VEEELGSLNFFRLSGY